MKRLKTHITTTKVKKNGCIKEREKMRNYIKNNLKSPPLGTKKKKKKKTHDRAVVSTLIPAIFVIQEISHYSAYL